MTVTINIKIFIIITAQKLQQQAVY